MTETIYKWISFGTVFSYSLYAWKLNTYKTICRKCEVFSTAKRISKNFVSISNFLSIFRAQSKYKPSLHISTIVPNKNQTNCWCFVIDIFEIYLAVNKTTNTCKGLAKVLSVSVKLENSDIKFDMENLKYMNIVHTDPIMTRLVLVK